MTAARVLLDKLHPLPNQKLPRISADMALSDFADHIDWLIARHVKKTYQQSYLVPWIFGVKRTFSKKSEADAYCRSSLVVASTCFRELIAEIRRGSAKASHKNFQRYRDIVRDYVFDLKPVAEHLEQQRDSSYELFSGGRNYGVHTWEVFRVSQQLAVQSAYRGTIFHVDHKTAQISSVFVLR